MLEEAIIIAKAGGTDIPEAKQDFSPQITVDAPILIPEEYVLDLDLRMGLYRRINEIEDKAGIEAFAAELIDRFGKLPDATRNLIDVIGIKLDCKKARIAKLDVGAKGALVTFANGGFPNIAGLLAYLDRLKDTAKLRPDQKLVITRNWADPAARLHGATQLAKGLAKAAG
jgi:transcription-repair coupling factor (superfamily II helicase)